MKKVQKISVSANKKRRSQAMQKPTSKIEKLSPASLENILKYFSHNEQIFFTSISSRFQKAFSQLHSIDHSVFRNFIKFLLFYKKIEKVSSPFSPYLNILLNMNLINLSYEEIKTDSKTGKNPTSKMLKDSKLNALKYFLNYRQDITSNKKIYISLSSYNDYLLYEEIIPLVKNFKECKYYLHIAQTNLKNFINKEVTMVNLLKQIPYVKCVGKPSESLLGKIQSSIFDQDIECMHYKIVLKSEENIEKAEKYFKKYLPKAKVTFFLLSIHSRKSPEAGQRGTACKSLYKIRLFLVCGIEKRTGRNWLYKSQFRLHLSRKIIRILRRIATVPVLFL